MIGNDGFAPAFAALNARQAANIKSSRKSRNNSRGRAPNGRFYGPGSGAQFGNLTFQFGDQDLAHGVVVGLDPVAQDRPDRINMGVDQDHGGAKSLLLIVDQPAK